MSWPGTEGGDQDGDSVFEAGEQLSLSGDQDRLPWLEADEDFEEEGSDYRIIVFALVAVLALATILGGAYYLLRGGSANGDVVHDGSTIAAPEEPYKERPEDPGGAEVAGTGDISFEVGEGQSIEGQLAVETPAPEVTPESEAATPAPAPATTGVAVQVGAYSTRASAAEGWVELRNRFQVLQGLERRIVEGSVDGSTIYRLQAIASDGAAADSLCRAMRADGGDCQVKR
jgi:hypothetical protein